MLGPHIPFVSQNPRDFFAKLLDIMNKYYADNCATLFVVVYLSFLLDNILLTIVVPVIPDYLFADEIDEINDSYNKRLSLSPLQNKYSNLDRDNGFIGALLASKSFVQLIFAPAVGYFIEKRGCALPLLIGSTNLLLASLLFAYGTNYGVLLLARILHGTASAAISVAGMTTLAKNLPKEKRQKLMPIAFGGIALGVLIGYPLGGAINEQFGKRMPFLMMALVISLNIGLQVNLWGKFQMESDENTSKENVSIKEIIKDEEILTATGAICVSTITMAILEPCVPIWLLGHIKPPPSRWQLGAVFIPDSVGYFLGSHFGGLLPMDPWRVVIAALVIEGLSSCGVPLIRTTSQLAVPHFGIGLGVGITDAILVPYIANRADVKGHSKYGSLYALQQIAVNLAYFVGPLFGGEFVVYFGFEWLIRLIGFFNIAYCPLMVVLEPKENCEKVLRQDSKLVRTYSTF